VSDLLVPVIAGVVMAIVALIAHHLWMQRDALSPRPDERAGGGVAHTPSVSERDDALHTLPVPDGDRRALPAPDDARRTLPVLRTAGSPAVSAATTPPRSGRLRPVMAAKAKALRGEGPGAEPLRATPVVEHAVTGDAITRNAPDRGGTRRRTDETSPAPARAARPGPYPRRGRSTIQLDPLDAPTDPHNARIAVGGLIDDLETGKLGRGR